MTNIRKQLEEIILCILGEVDNAMVANSCNCAIGTLFSSEEIKEDFQEYFTKEILSLEIEKECNCVSGYVFNESGSGICNVKCHRCSGTGKIKTTLGAYR